jgi:transcriptional regulator with PAS, ATPase and Fis domain
LKKTQGSQAKAAKLLGISERSMWYRVKKYEIDMDIK